MAKDIFRICDTVRQTAFDLHVYLRGGHLEKVYENGLAHRLHKQGLNVKTQHPLTVRDEDGTVLGQYCADLFIEDCLIVEIKACRSLADGHVAQLLGYLQACNVEHGLLINFGPVKLQVKKYALSHRVPAEGLDDE